MSAQVVEPDDIVVIHPQWCTDKSVEDRENNNDIELINDFVGVVYLVHTCPGPTFGHLRVSGRHSLPNGTWDFDVDHAHPLARARPHRFIVSRSSAGEESGREDSLGDLLRDLTAASDWINDQIAMAAHR